MANWDTMIDPILRYRELLEKRGRFARGEELSRVQNYYKEQDWRDLQVWFNLTWFDPYWTEHDAFIRSLREKGKGFTEEDKKLLLDKQVKICGDVAGKHKEFQDRGQIEITTSPFYHPILPLLCDTESARMAMPHAALPLQHFAFPEDARMQIQRALDDHTRRFGRPPRGIWPSEGSVSDAAAQIMIDCGVRWTATDEAILANSLSPGQFTHDDIYEPYRLEMGGKSLSVFFRDHELSDAIGFVYTTWNAADAVNDLIKRLHGIRQRLLQKEGGAFRPHVIPIILDGENCWEYYHDDGLPFLRGLYKALSDEPTLQTVLASEYLDNHPPARSLSRLWSGSWINANFDIWIGHPEDNQAWDLLYRTRQFLTTYLKNHPERSDSPEAKLAWEEIYIAEGSDWCWWYGDDHSSANDEAFDYLFRKHLMNVYGALGAKVPDDLRSAIKPRHAKLIPKPPIDFLSPKIDGRVTSYFEWHAAGIYLTEPGATGTMHRAQNTIRAIYYGYDLHNLYFRMDLSRPLTDASIETLSFKVLFSKPEGYEAVVRISQSTGAALQLIHRMGSDQVISKDLSTIAALKVIEFGISLTLFEGHSGPFEWVVMLEKDGLEQERWPTDSSISHPYPAEENFAQAWSI